MKVVKPGRASNEWKRELDCKSCGSVVEIEKSDLYVRQEWDISGKRDQVLADCGFCNRLIVVDDPAKEDWGELPRK